MWYDGLFKELEASKDPERAEKMSAYMKDKFPFLGLQKSRLDEIIKPYYKESRKADFDWGFVRLCWDKPYREAQYVAVGYVLLHQKKLEKDDLEKIHEFIVEKSWWETVDMLDTAVGTIVMKYPELKQTMLEWSVSDNLWLRRAAIDFQLKYKEQTDRALLSRIIQNNLGSKEFFINKAVGWSLREYAKTNGDWVRRFLTEFDDRLAPLSKREASKHLK